MVAAKLVFIVPGRGKSTQEKSKIVRGRKLNEKRKNFIGLDHGLATILHLIFALKCPWEFPVNYLKGFVIYPQIFP